MSSTGQPVVNAWTKKGAASATNGASGGLAADSSSGATAAVAATINPLPDMRQIMDEEIARELQEAENKKNSTKTIISGNKEQRLEEKSSSGDPVVADNTTSIGNIPAAEAGSTARDDHQTEDRLFKQALEQMDECSNDHLLAILLQTEYDKEHDKMLALEEKKWNGNDKIYVSFQNYRSTRQQDLFGVDSSGDEEQDEMDIDLKELRNIKLDTRRAPPDFGASGVIKKNDGKMVTKHDKVICGRKNRDRVMEFPPEFQTGDAVKMDMQLPNSVYNTLKTHMIQEEKRMQRILDKKDKATSEMALDMNTRIVIYKMINAGLLESVTGTIATGKEAIVLYAKGGDNYTEEKIAVPAECALKVYITMLVDFKNRSEYVKEDYRFKNRRKVLKIWAEKELMNLNRMKRAGVKCPSVVKLKKHVLVMSFIGDNGDPAPKLKEVDFSGDQTKLQKAYDQCVEAMKLMYDECKLVHGDFSEFNVLYWNEDCYVIDVAQSMDLSHPKSLLFLARDCNNLVKFFKKSGLESTPSDRELFVHVTGLKEKFESDENFYVDLEEYVNQNTCSDQRREKRMGGSSGAAARHASHHKHAVDFQDENNCED